MKPLFAAIAAVATGVALLAGCGGDDSKPAAKKKPPAASSSAKDTDGDGLADNSDPNPNEATADDSAVAGDDPLGESNAPSALGKALDLETFESILQVTAVKVLDPLPVGGDDSPMNPGTRFVGVQLKAQNVGDAAYDDSSANSTALLTIDGSQAESTQVFGGPCRLNDKDFLANVSPGDVRQGCVAFEVPEGAKLDKVQFTPDSGNADETGEWKAR